MGLRDGYPLRTLARSLGFCQSFLGVTPQCCAQFFQEAPVIARRTPEWFSRADDDAIFFYSNRKEIEIDYMKALHQPVSESIRAARLVVIL
jgi:hypothetical protein